MAASAQAAAASREAPTKAQALREAGFAALVMLGLSVPIVALRTEQNMENQLVLAPRYGMVLLACIGVFLARYIQVMFVNGLTRTLLIVGSFTLLGGVARATGQALDGFSVGVFVIGAALIAAGFAWQKRVDAQAGAPAAPAFLERFSAIQPYVGPAALGFIAVYPALALWLTGTGGSIKWIDNFGIQILIYIMLGWGLNIVVGLAGLLDLGYVAFYAVGAYSYALLATKVIPEVFPTLGVWSFWICLPISGILAALWGILLGFPVLRLRGDYLAIVTLAFGEIIRLVLINWVEFSNGYAGISTIPRPSFFGIPFNASDTGFAAVFGLEFSPIYRTIFLYYVILCLALLTAFVTLRLRRLPVGRAWEALREDEIACRSLGINTTNTKLTAFALGAMFGGFAGCFFAARQGFISPESFTFIESAQVLAIVVLGGTGSLVGVVIASIALVGGFEILRELDFLKLIFGESFDPTQYRTLLFGLAMVLIMLWKPRGLVSTREPTAFLKESKSVSGSLVKEGHG
ncbi:high-affinity branched-chain amino acid ABC transporter permease LivM [uncultured Alsobacter sp.]|uniref:high-affinity branched-chain amino acid ABC transporter permease LivM n=1 Tax=uncultured Alsobacter sp. TaxID=1748258 RepID=UPI0025CE0CC2|nr:high-affinity branched-chain amino acid ABC transporter permease LivM [uncultured Alsobacter sp.]